MSLEQEASDTIVNSADHPLRSAVLLGCIGTREAELNAMSGKVIMELGIVIFFAVVTLEGFDSSVELSLNICNKMQELREGFRL